jgi:hypothetical protein
MEFYLTRLYKEGRPLPKHFTIRSSVRGRLLVREQHDDTHRRMVRVARLEVPAAARTEAPPPLYDAVLLAGNGDWWTLAGFERLPAGPLHEVVAFAQTWYLVPAPLEDLIRAEQLVNRLSGELAERRKA